MAKTTRDKLPLERKIAIAEADVANAKTAVDHLPAIEQAARNRVEQARRQLEIEEENLRHVLEVEVPATNAGVGEAEKALATLTRSGK